MEVTSLVVHCFSVSLRRMLLLKSYSFIGSIYAEGGEYTALLGRLLQVNEMEGSLVVLVPPVYCCNIGPFKPICHCGAINSPRQCWDTDYFSLLLI